MDVNGSLRNHKYQSRTFIFESVDVLLTWIFWELFTGTFFYWHKNGSPVTLLQKQKKQKKTLIWNHYFLKKV